MSRNLRHFLRQALPWLPALITLALILILRVGLPYYDSWAFVEDYQTWLTGDYGLRELFATHGPHPSVPGKLIYWMALHWARGDVGWLPLLGWLFSLGAALSVNVLLRWQFSERKESRWWLQLLANACLFTTAQGSTWLWDFVFQNFIVGACLAASLACLGTDEDARRGALGAAVFATVGTLSFGSGFSIGWLLLPLLWIRRDEIPASRRMRWLVGGVVLALLLSWLAAVYLPSLGHAHEQAQASERAESVLGRPLMAVKYVLVVLGGSLGHGTSIDPEWLCMGMGALLMSALTACLVTCWRRRSNDALLRAAWPWIACCAFAVLNALLIALARMGKSYSTALAPRYMTFTVFLVLGVIMLIALLNRRGGSWASLLVGSFLFVQALNWLDGANAMRHFHHILTQNRAALSFAKVLPLQPGRVIQHRGPDSVKKAALFLSERTDYAAFRWWTIRA